MAVTYKIYGTNQPYTGRVIKINNNYYTTESGTLEGHSKQVVIDSPNVGKTGDTVAKPNLTPSSNTPNTNNNPIVDTFNAPQTPRYYYENGTLVPVGTPLHQHENNVVMTGLTMGPNEKRVFLTPPNTNTTMNRTNNTNTTAGRNMSRNGNRNGRAGNTGGGMGGY
tara:strand:+ start:43 stop:540 length:498 start_codon:yes stop_codon:yes gene_type:complete